MDPVCIKVTNKASSLSTIANTPEHKLNFSEGQFVQETCFSFFLPMLPKSTALEIVTERGKLDN
jgi:hypothetical protein